MRRWLAVLLLAAGALTLGFGLPLLAIRLQDTRTEEDEESAEVQQVDLSDSSGLTNVEKLALMTEPDVQVMDVGVAWHQTALSLENVCENVFLMMEEAGVPLGDWTDVQRESQTALLVSAGDRAFLLWEVCLTDGADSRCYFFLDDESGALLGIRCPGGAEPGSAIYFAYAATYVIARSSDWLWPEGAEAERVYAIWKVLAAASAEGMEIPALNGEMTSELEELAKSGTVEDTVTLSDGEESCTLRLEAGTDWFQVNAVR